MNNWKTTAAGVSAALVMILNMLSHWLKNEPIGLTPDSIAIIVGGIGLIFAKDWNMTGGTKSNGLTPDPVQKMEAEANVDAAK